MSQRSKPKRKMYPLRLPAELHRELIVFKSLAQRPLNDLLLAEVQRWWQGHPMRATVLAAIKKTDKSG